MSNFTIIRQTSRRCGAKTLRNRHLSKFNTGAAVADNDNLNASNNNSNNNNYVRLRRGLKIDGK